MAICISDITPGISLQRSILESEHKRYFERFGNIWTVFECSQMIISDWAQVIESVLGVILHTYPLLHVSSTLLVCKKEKKKDRVWWNGKETDYRKTATARQTNCPASLCESFRGNNSDGWEDERPVSWGHMLISLFLCYFTLRKPLSLTHSPVLSIHKNEGGQKESERERKREMDAFGDLQ